MSAPSRITSYRHDDLTFDVLDDGPLEGDPIVLLHGFPQMNTCWHRVAPLLHAAGHRTLAPNQRGYSPGARPRGRRPYRGAALVGDVAALIDELGAPAHVVGHDWGAAVAWGLAVNRPDLTRSLVSVSVPHPGAFLKAMPRGQVLKSWYMAFFNIPRLPEMVLSNRTRARASLRGSGMSEEMFEDFWRDFIEGGALPGGLGWYRALALADSRDLRTPATVPTTHVWSTGDSFLTRRSAELCGDFVRDAPYRLEILDGSHWLPEERPEELAAIILDRTASAAG